MTRFFSFLFLALAARSCSAFSVVVPNLNMPGGHVTDTALGMGMFGGLSDAFKNEDNLGSRKSEGLSGGPNYNEAVTINGKPVKAIVGQKVKNVAASARVKIPYNCQQGDCGTCMIMMNGRKVKACQMTIPAGKCTIETLN